MTLAHKDHLSQSNELTEQDCLHIRNCLDVEMRRIKHNGSIFVALNCFLQGNTITLLKRLPPVLRTAYIHHSIKPSLNLDPAVVKSLEDHLADENTKIALEKENNAIR